jgi:hypothetical protein
MGFLFLSEAYASIVADFCPDRHGLPGHPVFGDDFAAAVAAGA